MLNTDMIAFADNQFEPQVQKTELCMSSGFNLG